MSSDHIVVGGVRLKDFTFAEVDDTTGLQSLYTAFKFDGLLGLCFGALSVNGVKTPLRALMESDEVERQVFAFYMGKHGPSELVIGGINKKHYTGKLNYVPLYERNYWSVKIDGIYVGQQRIHGATKAIIDSGTSVILGSGEVVEKALS